MSFLDKLELMLIESPDIYCTAYYGVNSDSLVLEVNAHEINCCKNKQSYIKQGIIEMMDYLRDPINNKPQKYKNFFFNTSPNSIIDRIQELNPTDEDLINLYKHVAHGFTFSIFKFIPLLKSKENIIKLIKLGHNYTFNWDNRKSECLKECLLFLKQYNLSEDEISDVISSYVKNSQNIIKAEQERNLIALCNFAIKDEMKCQTLIEEIIGYEVEIQLNKIEKKVIKLEMDDSFFVRKYGFINPNFIEEFLINFEKQIKNNLLLLNHTLNLDYYRTKTHNLIVESNNGNSHELFEILDMYFNYFLSNKELNTPLDYLQYFYNNPENFRKMIWNATLKQDLVKNITITNKVVKV